MLTQTASSYQQSYVPYISQIDEIYAWMGCEPISALMGLKTLGYAQNVTPTAFLNALPITSSDPAKGFVGSPYHSDGRYSSIDPAPLADFCNRYTNGADVCRSVQRKIRDRRAARTARRQYDRRLADVFLGAGALRAISSSMVPTRHASPTTTCV